jgi:hypothetical protein
VVNLYLEDRVHLFEVELVMGDKFVRDTHNGVSYLQKQVVLQP